MAKHLEQRMEARKVSSSDSSATDFPCILAVAYRPFVLCCISFVVFTALLSLLILEPESPK